jgi:hypothetical protein
LEGLLIIIAVGQKGKNMRLIDADALIDKYQSEDSVDVFRYEVIKDLCEAPTVDAVPVRHGKWKLIRMEDNGDGFYTCSNCDRGDIHSPLVSVPYCWYCGAKMDEE